MKQAAHRGPGRPWALALALVAVLGWSTATDAQESYTLSGGSVAVYNLAGEVEIVPGNGSDVIVEVLRGGDDAAELDVEVGSVRGRTALVVHYPEDRIVYPRRGGGRSSLRVRDDGTFYEGDRGGRRVEIRGSGRGLEAFADLRIRVPSGSDFALFLAVGEATASGLEGSLLMDMGSGTADVTDIRGAVNIDTGSGSVTVRGVDGNVTVDTGSGGVRVSDVRGGRLVVDTGSGSVRGTGIAADQVAIDTGSGGVELGELRSRDISVDTGSGGVELDLMTDVDRLVVDTGSGGIRLTIPSDLGAEVEFDTGSGGIDVDIPVQVREARRSYLRGSLGDGDGFIELETGSGSIRVRGR